MLTQNQVVECSCEYRDGNFFVVDAWGSGEEGEVVAVIHTSGDVYKINVSACNSDVVQEVIKEKVKELTYDYD